MTAETWAGLSESARWTFRWLAKELEGGFTGKIELDCNQGGVTNVRPTPVIKPTREMERTGADGS